MSLREKKYIQKNSFALVSDYEPKGDQPKAVFELTRALQNKKTPLTLLGVTGSGKTFTIAHVIANMGRPTLVIAHNKTLAAQLCVEFRSFFPKNAVEYFVSYYDYYQPEAYMPTTDTYIEKEAQINEEIDRLRHACTQALLTRNDVIIVASVSAIYGLGSPDMYEKTVLHLSVGQELKRRGLTEQLISMQFERTNASMRRGTFLLRGQILEIMPVNEERVYRLEVGEKIERMEVLDPITRKILAETRDMWLFPAKHYVVDVESQKQALSQIRAELNKQLAFFKNKGKILEAERLKRRVRYDLELIRNLGYCNGIENYSRFFDGRLPGEPPFTLLDYFKHASPDFLTVIDESHVTLPQLRAMYHGDRARKNTLVDHGFRLPSACDNRPLMYDEFKERVGSVVYVSATPGPEEYEKSVEIVEQIVRPTGLVDPVLSVCPVTENKQKKHLSQVDDLLIRINERVKAHERVLVTSLTKKMAEDLSEYLHKKGIKVRYLHSDIKTVERIAIVTDLRKGVFDVLVGVNLLREGLDMPEVSLVAILDADKEGFLRSETSLIQTMGRAARNVNGTVILYADTITNSMKKAMEETMRRREIQIAYNKKHGITPKTIDKEIKNLIEEFGIRRGEDVEFSKSGKNKEDSVRSIRERAIELELASDTRPIETIIREKTKKMKEMADMLEFELASILRDEIRSLEVKRKKEMRSKTKKIKKTRD